MDREIEKGITAETKLGREPLHVAVQAFNNETAQALLGTTIAWAQVAQKDPGEALKRGLRGMGSRVRGAVLVGQAALGALNAAETTQRWAEEDGNPDIASPYEEEAATNPIQTTLNVRRPLPTLPSGLTTADVKAIEDISANNKTGFSRASSTPIEAPEAANILQQGRILGIEVFGFPLEKSDPRGNEQTQSRVQKLKEMAIKKLLTCGAVIQQQWGGDDKENPGKRVKERHVPPGTKGTWGARKSDLAFQVLWRDRVYTIDINTVDVLASGLLTSREARALKSLRANRITRLELKRNNPDFHRLQEYEGKVGAFKKGKGMSDEDWEKEAQEWVDEFVDCSEPLDVTLSEDNDARN